MRSFNIFEVFDQRTLDNDSMTVEDGGDCVPSWSQSEVDLRDQRTDNMQGGRSSLPQRWISLNLSRSLAGSGESILKCPSFVWGKQRKPLEIINISLN